MPDQIRAQIGTRIRNYVKDRFGSEKILIGSTRLCNISPCSGLQPQPFQPAEPGGANLRQDLSQGEDSPCGQGPLCAREGAPGEPGGEVPEEPEELPVGAARTPEE